MTRAIDQQGQKLKLSRESALPLSGNTQEEQEQPIARKLEPNLQMSVKLLPLYAASLCSAEWLDTVESYQNDPETLCCVLSDFCRKHRHLLCDCGACDSCTEEQTGRPHTCFLWMSYP